MSDLESKMLLKEIAVDALVSSDVGYFDVLVVKTSRNK